MRKREVIRELKAAQRIHAEWAGALRADVVLAKTPDYRALDEVVGTPEWHDHWVRVYDATLKLIDA